jgi:hypothetical protein
VKLIVLAVLLTSAERRTELIGDASQGYASKDPDSTEAHISILVETYDPRRPLKRSGAEIRRPV